MRSRSPSTELFGTFRSCVLEAELATHLAVADAPGHPPGSLVRVCSSPLRCASAIEYPSGHRSPQTRPHPVPARAGCDEHTDVHHAGGVRVRPTGTWSSARRSGQLAEVRRELPGEPDHDQQTRAGRVAQTRLGTQRERIRGHTNAPSSFGSAMVSNPAASAARTSAAEVNNGRSSSATSHVVGTGIQRPPL
jgi:hypothetical protein